MASNTKRLFEPITLGHQVNLRHRVVMAPLTRFRADKDHVHHQVAVIYYGQRASVPGTFIISEGTIISEKFGGFDNVPGIWNDVQVEAWRKITDEVHSKGSFIYCQLWTLGRAASPRSLAKTGHDLTGKKEAPTPRELRLEEIEELIKDYVKAAENAIEAGFDGVEIHAANGYLLNQFLDETANHRKDKYGGSSIENRTRIVKEVIDAVGDAIGAERTAIRFSPWTDYNGIEIAEPIPIYTHIIEHLLKHPLAYIHFVEPRVSGDGDSVKEFGGHETNVPLIQAWKKNKNKKNKDSGSESSNDIGKDRVVIIAGGFSNDTEKSVEIAEEFGAAAVAFGRAFVANPDLPKRLKEGISLNKYNRKTFYLPGPDKSEGYIDYPFAADVQSNL
ncbi:uncharacterized protein EI90DRAFT_3145240 [Cantharellus anzutake]|uniref:uncharacterized protein n=1 Tax=Cantharellus anzutake TaxID=1750568 RepID=UPI001908392A|nr:uncharacterized protein EI90DRAFT_3145240 [Cantharellus anzutake]KAF8333600.1 hypothetical protein EI90DRAFT_3145240 [Cantharellus anzutake]